MREIKFRGRRTDNGEWVAGLLTVMWGQYHIVNPADENTAYPIDPSTVGQFTGLHDCTKWENLTEQEREKWVLDGHMPSEWHGREIYEGGQVVCDGRSPATVEYCPYEALFHAGNDPLQSFVIGSAHPESMEDWERSRGMKKEYFKITSLESGVWLMCSNADDAVAEMAGNASDSVYDEAITEMNRMQAGDEPTRFVFFESLVDHGMEYEVAKIEMTDEEYGQLPEFDGF